MRAASCPPMPAAGRSSAPFAYAFLIHLLATQPDRVRLLLRLGYHRTGRHAGAVTLPLYRLHAAVASLLAIALPPPLARLSPT